MTSIYVIDILGNIINIVVFSRRVLHSNICLRYFIETPIVQILLFNTVGLTRALILLDMKQLQIHACIAPIDSAYAQFYVIQTTVSSIMPFIIISVFTSLTIHNIRNYRRIQITTLNSVVSTTVSSRALPLNTNHRRPGFQLMKISFLQMIFYVILAMISTILSLYSYLTSTLSKSTDQLAIDTFIISASKTFLECVKWIGHVVP
ncbi:unnamed protein product [Adineta ricciae]|uniref:G protein-coupled receptor n=1 Tax=Adineta ricciae TaxID=249248 RepID=A0A816F714_ADIRI|nr:unnamed protein product [Adineta ricciae]CAF1655732.1 unnamed protein product [Adineta ricciae]